MMTFLVITNTAEHSGLVAQKDQKDIWSNNNPSGWTYQEVAGTFGTVYLETEDENEAYSALEDWLECDSVENGTYCYTHNPTPRR